MSAAARRAAKARGLVTLRDLCDELTIAVLAIIVALSAVALAILILERQQQIADRQWRDVEEQ